MSTLSIALPDEDLAFLRRWTAENGTSAEEFFASHASNLRKHLEKTLPEDVATASGVIATNVDASESHLDYLTKKHQ